MGFSKKAENHAHSVALFAMYYNFVRILWFWRPHAGVKSSGGQSARPGADKALIRWATVSNKPGHRGEHEGNP